MRSLILFALLFAAIPFVFGRPWLGGLLWTWLGMMNPQRLTFGSAYDFPFSMIVAIVTVLALLFSRTPKRFPVTLVTVILITFVIWMTVTTLFALNPAYAWPQWQKVAKIQVMILVLMMVLQTPRHFNLLVWVIVLSLGFYGVKGGLFTILSGGKFMVLGPESSFIEGNTEISLALIMTLPLMHYLQLISTNKWVRHGLGAAMLLSAFAFIGSYSRGALLAGAAMAAFLWLKSRNKMMIGLLLVVATPLILLSMPDKWHDRMATIKTYEQDSSAMGRINAWYFARNVANDSPLVGGGFEIWEPQFFAKYAPNPADVHAAHSIYFAVLGEHGYVGLILFLGLWFFTWRTGSWIIRNTGQREDIKWASDMARMIQASLVGYFVGGAFLSLAYFDLPYNMLALLVLVRLHVEKVLAAEAAPMSGRSFGVYQAESVGGKTSSEA